MHFRQNPSQADCKGLFVAAKKIDWTCTKQPTFEVGCLCLIFVEHRGPGYSL
jgi:hypothetical protein